MRSVNALMLASLVLPASPYAADCVKLRTENESAACMEFTEAATQAAIRYGLTLGSPYATVRTKLVKSGWRPNLDWAQIDPQGAHPDGLVCGQGLDAVCHLEFTRSGKRLALTFSYTNAGTPLIDVSETQ